MRVARERLSNLLRRILAAVGGCKLYELTLRLNLPIRKASPWLARAGGARSEDAPVSRAATVPVTNRPSVAPCTRPRAREFGFILIKRAFTRSRRPRQTWTTNLRRLPHGNFCQHGILRDAARSILLMGLNRKLGRDGNCTEGGIKLF